MNREMVVSLEKKIDHNQITLFFSSFISFYII
jgi:hypothetical protein